MRVNPCPRATTMWLRVSVPHAQPREVRFIACALAVVLCTATCIHPPRAVPRVATGEQFTRPVDATRSGTVLEEVPAAPEVVWRKGVGHGLAVPLSVNQSIVLATTTNRAVVTLSAESGRQYWLRRFNGAVAGMAVRRDDRVFLATAGREERVFALDIVRGRTLWSRQVGVVLVEPLLIDNALYVAAQGGRLIAINAETGTSDWEVGFSAAPAIAPMPASDDVLHATHADTLYRVAGGDGRIVDRIHLRATPSAPAALTRELVLLALHSSDVIAVTLAAFREAWRVTLPAPVLAAPRVAPDGSIYFLTRTAEVWRVSADGGEPHRVAAPGGAASGSFALTRDGLLVGRLDGSLLLVGFDGRIIWQRDFDDSIVAPAVAHNRAVYVPLLRGDVVKLQ